VGFPVQKDNVSLDFCAWLFPHPENPFVSTDGKHPMKQKVSSLFLWGFGSRNTQFFIVAGAWKDSALSSNGTHAQVFH